jgi:DNA-binding NtrC family response regulator
MVQATPVRLLAIDTDRHSLDAISQAFSRDHRLTVLTADDPSHGWELILKEHPAIVLLNPSTQQGRDTDLLKHIFQHDPAIEVIFLNETYLGDSVLTSIQEGAYDCLTKPIQEDQLRDCISRLITAAENRQHTLRLDRELTKAFCFEGMVGRSPLMLEVYSRIERIAPHFRTALISGPTGTGKELAARALHARSPMRDRPFVAFNCAAVVESLAESELFGHVKGAFTGAVQDRIGIFEYAQGGTVFLDEIGDMPASAQAKLLRVIQNQEVQRVGSPITKHVDVRIIAATNRDLQELVHEKLFREDLYYRIGIVQIRLPSLAERREDLPLLLREFVERCSAQYGKNIRGITRRAQSILYRHSWPGNVRELENVVAHGCMMANGQFIDVSELPEGLCAPLNTQEPLNGLHSLAEMERRYARQVVAQLGGNKLKAAGVLKVSRGTLYRLLAEDADGETPAIFDSEVEN